MIEHQITMTREQLQHEWDLSCRLVERLTEAVKTLAAERDEARKQRDEFLGFAKQLSPEIGWRGFGENKNIFYCEHCRQSHEVDADIAHTDKCLVKLLRELISSVEKSVTNPSHERKD